MFKQFVDLFLISLCLVYPGFDFICPSMVTSTVFCNCGSCGQERPTSSEGLQWRTVRGFFIWGNKRPKCAYLLFLSIVRAPAMGWCCDSLPKPRICSRFWGTRGLQCHHHHYPTGTTQRENTYSKEGASLQALYIRALLSSPQQGSRTRFPDRELEQSDDYKNTRYEFQKVETNSFCLFILRFIQIA